MTEPVDLISLEMLRQLLAIQTNLCDGLKAQQGKLRVRMIDLLYQFAPEDADQLARSAHPLEGMRDEDLLERIRLLLEKGLAGARVQRPDDHLADLLQQRNAQIEAQSGLIDQLKADKERSEQQVAQLTNRLEAMQQILNQNQSTLTKIVEPPAADQVPEWFSSWKGARGFET